MTNNLTNDEMSEPAPKPFGSFFKEWVATVLAIVGLLGIAISVGANTKQIQVNDAEIQELKRAIKTDVMSRNELAPQLLQISATLAELRNDIKELARERHAGGGAK